MTNTEGRYISTKDSKLAASNARRIVVHVVLGVKIECAPINFTDDIGRDSSNESPTIVGYSVIYSNQPNKPHESDLGKEVEDELIGILPKDKLSPNALSFINNKNYMDAIGKLEDRLKKADSVTLEKGIKFVKPLLNAAR
jgi:hypothetical protein